MRGATGSIVTRALEATLAPSALHDGAKRPCQSQR
jgi:hypothetical protein